MNTSSKRNLRKKISVAFLIENMDSDSCFTNIKYLDSSEYFITGTCGHGDNSFKKKYGGGYQRLCQVMFPELYLYT